MSSDFVGDDLATTAKQWRTALSVHTPKLTASEMYMGRSMVDAKFVAEALHSPLYVASAGLGLVAGNEEVSPYDLTASGARGGLQEVLLRLEATSAQWWNLLCGGRGLACLLARHPEAILLAALPANYVEMVAPDLSQLPPEAVQRLRLFTSQLGAGALPTTLADIAMPYDDRLESVPNYAGTRADFPQRAMRHYVVSLGGHHLPLRKARDAVQDALKSYEPPRPVNRQRADDEAIKRLLRKQWRETGGRGTTLLRYLRDEALISCEQGRFSKLWREVRSELAYAAPAGA